jgi:hypothetical protein
MSALRPLAILEGPPWPKQPDLFRVYKICNPNRDPGDKRRIQQAISSESGARRLAEKMSARFYRAGDWENPGPVAAGVFPAMSDSIFAEIFGRQEVFEL